VISPSIEVPAVEQAEAGGNRWVLILAASARIATDGLELIRRHAIGIALLQREKTIGGFRVDPV
jgi:hypothetical protein